MHSPPFFLRERPFEQISTFSSFACSWCTFAGYWESLSWEVLTPECVILGWHASFHMVFWRLKFTIGRLSTIWKNHLAETSKLHPEWRLGCCTLQLDFPRRSGTYSDLKFNRIVVQSTLLHFSSESGPSGKFRHFQILHVHDARLQAIGNHCPGKS